MKTELLIKAPEGFVINEELYQKEGRIEFIPANKKRRWEDFGEIKGFYISTDSDIISRYGECSYLDKNVWPTRELAEAALALSQLMQWRKKIVGDWEPDWRGRGTYKWCIVVSENVIEVSTWYTHAPLSFQKEKQAQDFLKEFGDLIQIAKPLL